MVTTLDSALGGRAPALIKIDVEGGETEVLTGAARTLSSEGLLALIVEIWDPGKRNADVRLREAGSEPVPYKPFTRILSASIEGLRGNTIFIRNAEQVRERLRAAPAVSVLGSLV